MKEVWKDIPGYEGIYQASDQGRIKSLERLVRNGSGSQRLVKERILSENKNTDTYYSVMLYKNNESKMKQIHKLVAMAFLGHVPDGNKIVVDHIDHDKLNNKVSNLEVVTQRENVLRALKFRSKAS